MPVEKIQKLVHELQVHQIELEMQNEELRQAQAELGESLDRFNDLYDFAPVGYLTLDPEGTVLEANLRLATMLGVERQKLIGRKFTRFVARNEQDTLYLHRRATLEGTVRQSCDLVLHRPDGTTFAARLECIGIRNTGAPAHSCRCAILDITERKRAEDALAHSHAELERRVAERTAELRESERTARAVVDGLASHIAIVDEKGQILAVNRRWRDFAKLNQASFVAACEGANYLAVCDAAGRRTCPEAAAVAEGIRNVLAGRSREFISEYPCHSATEERWFMVRATPFPGEGPRRVVISHSDITGRVQAEQAVRREREFSDRLIDTVKTIVLLLSPEGRILRFNRHLEELSGWTLEEARGQDWFDLFLPERDRAPIRQLFQHAMRGGDTRGNVNPIMTKDGRELEIEWHAALLKDSQGRLVGLLSSGRDITERKRGERALQESVEHLRATLHTVADAVITIDQQGKITSVNPATEGMFGYSAAEMVGQNVNLLMPSPYREEHDGYLANFHRTGVARIIGIGREVQGQRKDGTIFPIELAVGQVDHMRMFTGVIRDITDRKRLEAEVLRITEEERTRVAADLHDGICQELVAIQFLAVGLRQDLDRAGHPLAGQARRIEEATSRTAADIQQVARGMNPVVADGSGLMHALRRLAETTSRSRGIGCTFQCPTPVSIETPTVANEIYRIAQEAIYNAVRHSRAERITVRLSETGREICLAVTDNGCGLPTDVSRAPGMGLRVMRYRAGVIGGKLVVQPRTRGGTEVICRVAK